MRQFFSRRPLWRRAIALTAAYAIALSSLIATFGAARAAAEAPAQNVIICHTLVAGDEAPSPASDQSNDRHCAANCCTGCLMLLAALPPPPNLAGAPLAVSQTLLPSQSIVLVGSRKTKDHRSRAPPLDV